MSNWNKFTSTKIAWLLYDPDQAVLRLGLDCVSAGVSRVLFYFFYACSYSRPAAFVFSEIYAGYENLRWLFESTLAGGISSAARLVSEGLTPDSQKGRHLRHVYTTVHTFSPVSLVNTPRDARCDTSPAHIYGASTSHIGMWPHGHTTDIRLPTDDTNHTELCHLLFTITTTTQ